MNTKNNSILVKTLKYLIIFGVSILLLLWLFQISFLKIFYKQYQIKEINKLSQEISTINNLKELEKLAYKYNTCIEISIDNETTYYNNLNNNCILNSNSNKITKKIDELKKDKKNKYYIVKNSKNKTSSILYGINYTNNTYIILNTSLEDANTTTHILTGQLIYITYLVIIVSIVVAYYVSKMITKPIQDITKKAHNMAINNYELDNNNYNIKEIDDLKDVLNYARSEIAQTDQIRKDLMANVSHDLKTPLTMIKAYAEMIRDIDSPETRNSNLDIIIDETDRLNILVNDILDLSKLENNKEELDITKYDLVEELQNILKRYEIIKQTENYKFILNLPLIAPVKADKNKINQVIYNLINNAINYTGEDLTIKINLLELKTKYKLEIIDTGKGIDKEDINLIWTKYYKKEKNHKRNVVGTGLGLSIVKNILEKHNFSYGVESKKNKGSKFYFYIDKIS